MKNRFLSLILMVTGAASVLLIQGCAVPNIQLPTGDPNKPGPRPTTADAGSRQPQTRQPQTRQPGAQPASPAPQVSAAPVVTPPVVVQPAWERMNPIQACDLLASSADDPEAFAPGVTDASLDTSAVIKSCEAAVTADKTAPRLLFQLARGYIKAGRMEEAIERLIAAAQMRHGASLAYLGDIHLNGGPGIEPDPETARGLYTQALASGFQPAKTVLAEFEDFTAKLAAAEKEEKASASGKASTANVPGKAYAEPRIIEAVQAGNFQDVPGDDTWAKAYLIEIADTLKTDCKAHFTQAEIDGMRERVDSVDLEFPFLSLQAKALSATIMLKTADALRRNNYNPAADDAAEMRELENRIRSSIEKGVYDGIQFKNKNSCASPVTATFVKNIKAFVNDVGMSRPSTRAMWDSCNARVNKSGSPQGQLRCHCFTKIMLTKAEVTRKQWTTLVGSYEETGIEIIQKHSENNRKFQECYSTN